MTAIDDIRASFEFFDDWEDKYRFIIDLGKSLPHMPAEHQVEANLVRGCQSQVWLLTDHDSTTDTLNLQIDSDAHIVRGLIAIVIAAYEGKTPTKVTSYDIEALFGELDLLSHLSTGRGNGLRAMVSRIREAAGTYAIN